MGSGIVINLRGGKIVAQTGRPKTEELEEEHVGPNTRGPPRIEARIRVFGTRASHQRRAADYKPAIAGIT